MIQANHTDRSSIVEILTRSFDTNQSVNYIIPQDSKREERIRRLMEYSFDVCIHAGNIFLSNNRKACALLLFPDKKTTTFQSIMRDIQFIFSCIGIGKVKPTLEREARIKEKHPTIPFIHLWYIGVLPEAQLQGNGTKLLKEIQEWALTQNRPIYLETSTITNLPFYKKEGFEIFAQIDFSYRLYCLSNHEDKSFQKSPIVSAT